MRAFSCSRQLLLFNCCSQLGKLSQELGGKAHKGWVDESMSKESKSTWNPVRP
ncbi:hypothetical protein GUITHDRAFT_153772 [Guillardia theta CCMP2712]|uniref:Uncharacterized protein n=1 Tax=Guillardia theta (strain CCMP2712) TaxID=905079 RepID=L1IZ85_GUITC|nr:hypothetical protein GUITHDRAFT_153772 [Guillardia theta CCMP2712]EKX41556.1 hypothetical protein GUITHDRAFT_153772 [Guillardia theta CCMP2712]|eukprot:XP_005828536.1 hypothetical protein GUITHDRAFT_153772 [Guillardia theta CCMP2712]